LNGYHASCSYMAIRVMVDEAINRRTAEATAGPQNRVLTLSEQERGELSQTLELKTVLSDADIVAAIALDLEPSRAAVIALMPGFVDTQLERVSGEPNPINLTAFFGDRVNRQRLTGALLADDLGTYGAYLALARTALQTRSFAGETPAPAPTPAPTESTPQPESPLPPPAQ
jgi:hypothetical protein